MTTWTTLSAGAVGVGGIPSGSTVTALRDNPVAIAEGASGAPRIYGLAAARSGNGLPVITISASDAVQINEGTHYERVIDGFFTTTSLVTVLRFTMTTYTGSARFLTTGERGDVDGTFTSFNWYWKVDGVTAFTGYVSASAGQSIPSRDITFTAGQVVTLEIDIDASQGTGVSIRRESVTANDGYVQQLLYKLNSE